MKVTVVIKTVLALIALMCSYGIRTTDPITLIASIGIYYILRNESAVKWCGIRVLAIIFSIITVLCIRDRIPLYLDAFTLSSFYSMYLIAMYAFVVVGWYQLFHKCLQILYDYWDKAVIVETSRIGDDDRALFGNRSRCKGIVICFVSWMPYFILNFPGILSMDSIWQLYQITGIHGYSNHHPWAHTMLIKLFYEVGVMLTNSEVLGAACYIIFQMLFLATIVTSLVIYLYKMGVKRTICYVIMAYYLFVPYNAMYAITMWKDITFAACTLLLTMQLYRIYVLNDKSGIWEQVKLFTGYWLCGVAFSLFRNNGWYAMIVCIPIVTLVYKKYWKQLLLVHCMIIMSVLTIKGPVMEHFEVSESPFVESLSIPAQQIARVVYIGNELSEKQVEQLERVVDLDELKEKYVPWISDPVKGVILRGNPEYLEDNIVDYFKLWLEIGMKYPMYYLTAYLDSTSGYYFPDTQYVIAWTGVHENEIGIEVTELYHTNLANEIQFFQKNWQKVTPVVGLLASIGTMVWYLWILLFYCIYRKQYQTIIIFLPVVAVWATLLIATPVYAEFRYIYGLFYTVPFLSVLPFLKTKGADHND